MRGRRKRETNEITVDDTGGMDVFKTSLDRLGEDREEKRKDIWRLTRIW